MLSLEQCRRLLGPGCELSDEELERLRDELYALADIAVAGFVDARSRRDHRGSGGSPKTENCRMEAGGTASSAVLRRKEKVQ